MSTPIPPTNVGAAGYGAGYSPTPSYNEVQDTSAAQIRKDQVGLALQTDDKLLTDLDPRNRFKDGTGYPSSASRPILDHSIERAFGPKTPVPPNDTSWQPIYKQLFAKLPPDIQTILQQEQKLPFDERTPEFVILKNLLEQTAKQLAQLEMAAKGPIPGGTEEAREKERKARAKQSLADMVTLGHEIEHFTTRFLEERGPNLRNFDAINDANSLFRSHLTDLREILDTHAKGPTGHFSAEDQNKLNKLASALQTLSHEYSHHVIGNEMLILPSFASAFALLASANTLPSPSHFLSLRTASLGLLDPAPAEDLKNLILGLYPDLSPAGQKNMEVNTTFALIAATGLASQLANPKQGLAGRLPAAEFDNDHFPLYTIAAITMVTQSGFIGHFFNDTIQASAGSEKMQKHTAPILTEITHFLMLLAATRQHGAKSLVELLPHFSSRFSIALASAEQLTEKAPPELAIAIRRLQSCLNEKRYEDFIETAIKLLIGGLTPAKGESGAIDRMQSFDRMRLFTTQITYDALSGTSLSPVSGVIDIA